MRGVKLGYNTPVLPPISPAITPSERRRVWALAGLLVLASAAPYALAYAWPGAGVFAGLLFNPYDGQSYLAKMQLGWHGAWAFDLPYTAGPVPGVFIYTYYLFLGHVARWTGLGVEPVYHLARMLAGGTLLLSAYHFIAHFFECPGTRLKVWLLYALGSGLGWAAALGGQVTSDLWVAEAIPWLSVFSSSHFCLTAALMLWVLEWSLAQPAAETPRCRWARLGAVGLGTTAMAQTQPLALIVLGVVLAALTALWAWRDMRGNSWTAWVRWPGWWPLAVMGLCALPWLIFDAWVMLTVFQGWNTQNQTASPPAWDALLSGGVPLALAVAGSVWVGAALWRRRPAVGLVPLVWLGLNILMLYLPWSLQRRLSLGIWMPLVILAGLGWREVLAPRLGRRARALGAAGLGVAAGLSNVLVLAGALSVMLQAGRQPLFYLSRDEAAGLAWLGARAQGEVVLAGPETGLFIPARAWARVVYGHPFETVNAEANRQAVTAFFAGQGGDDLLARPDVAYIFYGPRERALGTWAAPPGWTAVFQQGEVTIYAR